MKEGKGYICCMTPCVDISIVRAGHVETPAKNEKIAEGGPSKPKKKEKKKKRKTKTGDNVSRRKWEGREEKEKVKGKRADGGEKKRRKEP